MAAAREAENRLLTEVVESARSGRAAVVQLVGEAGIGKSFLLTDLASGTQGVRVLRSEGVPSEVGLPFGCLQALMHPLTDLLPQLPPDEARALSVALGIARGDSGGDLVLGVAFLHLLGIAAQTTPVLLLVDDLQWADERSYRCLSFVARRLGPEAVAAVLATRPGRAVDGLRTVELTALSASDATALLEEAHPDLGPRVRQEVLDRGRGNPLALLEQARDLTQAQRRGLEPVIDPTLSPASIHQYFTERVAACPVDTQLMMLLVALHGQGESSVVAAAGRLLGIAPDSLGSAERRGLVEVVGPVVRFRNAVVGQAVLQLASLESIRAGHRALAAVLDERDPSRVWHAAAACDGPDAVIAAQLDDAAREALRAGLPTAAAPAFARAAALSVDPADRAARLLRAAEAALAAGAAALALTHVGDVDEGMLPPGDRAEAAWLRGRIELLLGHPQAAAASLVRGAGGRPAVDRAAALCDVIRACVDMGDMDFARLMLLRAQAVESEAGHPPEEARTIGLHVGRARAAVLSYAGDIAGAVASLRPSLQAFAAHPPGEDATLWLALGEAHGECGELMEARTHFLAAAGVARLTGDVGRLSDALSGQAFTEDVLGLWTAAYATGTMALEWADGDRAPLRRLEIQAVLAEIDAARGHESRCRAICAHIRATAGRLDLPSYLVLADRREALLDLGLNRLPAALERLERANSTARLAGLGHPFLSSAPDLVEVLVRLGRETDARPLLDEFSAIVPAGSPPSARARLLRTQALLADEASYPRLFAESVALDERIGLHFLRARTLLCWGERLRRDQHRLQSQTRLEAAQAIFDTLEAAPWSARAHAELTASGRTSSPPAPPDAVTDRLTPQELQIAVLVAEGRSNREIAGMLFLSVRTVEFHLTSVFRKLGTRSRSQLTARILTGSAVPRL